MDGQAEHNGTTVLITGSSRGIGLAIAKKFADHGYNVVLNCRMDLTGMEAAATELKKTNASVICENADVSDENQVAQMFGHIRNVFGHVDILINNAGISHYGLFQDCDFNTWDAVIKTNLYSVLNCCRQAVPNMIHEKKGVIINISSVWGNIGAACETIYSASKGGINAFTRALAKELGPSGVRVNAVACGAIETDMNSNLTRKEKNAFTEKIPMMRFGLPEEAASLVYYLSTNESSYITGQVISLDGGCF